MHSEKGFAESFNFLLFTRENFSPIKEMELNTSFAAVKLAGSIIGQNIPPPKKKENIERKLPKWIYLLLIDNLTTTIFIKDFVVVHQIVFTTYFESQRILFSLSISFLYLSLTIEFSNSASSNSKCQEETLLVRDTHFEVRDVDIVQISTEAAARGVL